MRNAVIDTATGAVKRFGHCDFSVGADFNPATETQVAIGEGAAPIFGLPHRHMKIANGLLIEMTQGEKDAADGATVFVTARLHQAITLYGREVILLADWTPIGATTAAPSTIAPDISKVYGKLSLSVKTTGAGAEVRVMEADDAGVIVQLTDPAVVLPDTAGAWKTHSYDTNVAPRAGRNRYYAEARLGSATNATIDGTILAMFERSNKP